ncbi:hypothetical protein ACVWXU_002298 [Streptomyces sp. TE33382]
MFTFRTQDRTTDAESRGRTGFGEEAGTVTEAGAEAGPEAGAAGAGTGARCRGRRPLPEAESWYGLPAPRAQTRAGTSAVSVQRPPPAGASSTAGMPSGMVRAVGE